MPHGHNAISISGVISTGGYGQGHADAAVPADRRKADWPHREFLEWHLETVFKAS